MFEISLSQAPAPMNLTALPLSSHPQSALVRKKMNYQRKQTRLTDLRESWNGVLDERRTRRRLVDIDRAHERLGAAPLHEEFDDVASTRAQYVGYDLVGRPSLFQGRPRCHQVF